ncbi:MAG TPA: hypothetical protein VNJ51_06725 [Candidatus Dormibacteraeota bacterium]|nr:hypothetical protein [Candidatus Dormibacteraeota bacterium]
MSSRELAGAGALQPRILAHYQAVGPLLERSFAGAPIVYANFPAGLDHTRYFRVLGVPLSERKLVWTCHRYYAVEFHTWAPLPEDEDRLRFARILLEPQPATPAHPKTLEARIKEAALAVREALQTLGLDAIPLLDGTGGIALWVPFADAPHAAPLRAWLHRLAARVIAKHPALVSGEPNSHADGRVHLHVSSNAPGHYSAMPYSLRGARDLPVCTPIRWQELSEVHHGQFTADTIQQRLAAHGDVFAAEAARLAQQTFAAVQDALTPHAPTPAETLTSVQPRGHIIAAAVQILEDGKVRTSDQILAEALRRKLVPAATTKKYVYSALIEYIARQIGHGRKPPLVQTADRRFRINEPPDDWPDLVPQSQPAIDAKTHALIERLETTAVGTDPAAFELAVCDAFAHLGFAATHIGGHKAPDGYADAQLGVLGYRAMLECKTGKYVVNRPDVAEAAKFKDAYHADACALIGPAYGEEIELQSELRTHGVAAFTVEDLTTLLSIGADAHEMRALFAPGFAADALGDLVWNRLHGERKRLADVAAYVRAAGWQAQVTAAEEGGPANAPRLTVDAAMLLVDAALRDAGSTQACKKEEVHLAFQHLTNPLTGAAVWTDDTRTAIVVTSAP